MTGRRRTPRPWPRIRPAGGYRLRLCSECSTAPAEQDGLCRRCAERERRDSPETATSTAEQGLSPRSTPGAGDRPGPGSQAVPGPYRGAR